MKNISKNLKYSIVVFILFLSQLTQAQVPDFDDDVQDVPTQAPIDQWVLPVILIMITIMFLFIKKHQNLQKQL